MKRAQSKARAMPLREVKARLSEVIDTAQETYVLITRHGRPAAVLIGVADLDALGVARRFARFDEH